MRITPEKTTFVKISEMCSDDVNVVKLRYEDTWRNVNVSIHCYYHYYYS